MKKMKTKKILVTLFVIFLALSIVGITNLISYAKNENVNKIAETIQEKTPKISISFDKNIYEFTVGSKIEITAKINKNELNNEGEHPDKIECIWYKITGGRPSPFEVVKGQTTEVLTIENAQLSDAKKYMVCANIMRWNEEKQTYEAIKEGNYVKSFYSNQITIDILSEINIDLKGEDGRLNGNKETGYLLELKHNDTYKLDLDLYRFKGNIKVVPQQKLDIKWTSSNENIVEVNEAGHLIAKGYSDEVVTITATVTDLDGTKKSISVKVKVDIIPVSDVTINEDDIELEVDEKTTLTATIAPENASNQTITWKLAEDSNTGIIEIESQTGVVTGKKIGEAKVVAMVGEIQSEPITIKVIETPVESITDELTIDSTTNKVNISLVENGDGSTEAQHSLTIHPEVLPKNATNKKITWKSDNEEIAKVRENSDGSVTFIAGKYVEKQKNECDITATSEENENIKRIYHITLKDHYIPVNVENGVVITTEKEGKEVDLSMKSVEELEVGDTIDFNFKINPSNATYQNDTWTVSSRYDSAKTTNVISIDKSGVVTANEVGTAYVRLTVTCQNPDCPKHSTYVTVKVNPKPVIKVGNVEIEGNETITLEREETITLNAKVTPEDATEKTITWSSNNSKVAEVNSVTGEVTAIAPGTAIITATADGKSDSVEIIVEPIKVKYIEISDSKLTVNDNAIIGENKLTVKFYPPNAENTDIIWKSSDETIVEIRDDGIIVPKNLGTATITVSLKNDSNKKATCEVTVAPSKARVIVYTIDQKSNFVSGINLRLVGKDSKGVEITPIQLSTNGKCDFGEISNGAYTIQTIIPRAINNGLNIIDYVEICSFEIINGQIFYSNLSGANLNYAESLVLVNIVDYPNEDEDGLIADIGAGENFGRDGKTLLELYEEYNTVKEIPVESIIDELKIDTDTNKVNVSLVENSSGSTEPKYSLTIHPEVLPENATNKEITWMSSDENVAKVVENDDGSVTFIAGKYDENNNTCTITATSHNGKTREYYITVKKDVVKVDDVKITIDGIENLTETYKLKVGEKVDLNFEVTPEDATYEHDSWSFEPEIGSPADVISIDNSGLVSANEVGKAYVIVKVTCQSEKCPTHEAKILIEVIPVPVENVEIELDEIEGEKTLTLKKDTTKQLTAIVTPINATDKTVTWTSDNENIAIVDSEGNVKAVGAGETIIRAKSGDKEDQCTIIVPQVKVDSIKISNDSLTVKDNEVNGENKLTFSFSPENADNAEFEWKSSDPDIADVEDGIIIPKKEGKVIITVFVKDDDSVYATCEVTVVASSTENEPEEGEEGNTPEVKPGDEESNPENKPEQGENTPEVKPEEENNTNNNVTNSSSNSSTPTTSDMPIVTYIMLMIVSLMLIVFIIAKRNKKGKNNGRYKK